MVFGKIGRSLKPKAFLILTLLCVLLFQSNTQASVAQNAIQSSPEVLDLVPTVASGFSDFTISIDDTGNFVLNWSLIETLSPGDFEVVVQHLSGTSEGSEWNGNNQFAASLGQSIIDFSIYEWSSLKITLTSDLVSYPSLYSEALCLNQTRTCSNNFAGVVLLPTNSGKIQVNPIFDFSNPDSMYAKLHNQLQTEIAITLDSYNCEGYEPAQDSIVQQKIFNGDTTLVSFPKSGGNFETVCFYTRFLSKLSGKSSWSAQIFEPPADPENQLLYESKGQIFVKWKHSTLESQEPSISSMEIKFFKNEKLEKTISLQCEPTLLKVIKIPCNTEFKKLKNSFPAPVRGKIRAKINMCSALGCTGWKWTNTLTFPKGSPKEPPAVLDHMFVDWPTNDRVSLLINAYGFTKQSGPVKNGITCYLHYRSGRAKSWELIDKSVTKAGKCKLFASVGWYGFYQVTMGKFTVKHLYK